MTRDEFNRLPKPESMWLELMQEAVQELKIVYSRIDTDSMSDAEVEAMSDRIMERLI